MPIPPTHEPDDDAGRRRHAAILGMWVFLAAEAVFFGGALVCFAAYAWQHGPEFAKAGNLTNLALGAANTAVLLTSSWTMAMAVHASHAGRRSEERRVGKEGGSWWW